MEFVLIFGIGVVILGVIYLISTFVGRNRKICVADWPTVPGVVRDVFVYRHEKKTPSGSVMTYTPVLAYTYTVEGETYLSRRRDLSPYTEVSFEDPLVAEAVVAKYPLGSAVMVHYHPALPQQAVLEVHKPAGYRLELASGVFNLLVGAGMILLYINLR